LEFPGKKIKRLKSLSLKCTSTYFVFSITYSDPKKGAIGFFRILKFWEKAMLSPSLKGKIRLKNFSQILGALKKLNLTCS
jgi:hypothetical protein